MMSDQTTQTDSDTAARARALLAAATPGPWQYQPPAVEGTIHEVVKQYDDLGWAKPLLRMEDTGYSARTSWDQRKADAELIAAAPTLIADLLAERDALAARLDGILGAIGDPDELRWHRWHCDDTGNGDDLRDLLVRIADAADHPRGRCA